MILSCKLLARSRRRFTGFSTSPLLARAWSFGWSSSGIPFPCCRELAVFIARNLPFVDQVALMGLEMTGLARPNSAEVWIDPADYQAELMDATFTLAAAGIATKIYNHQLCVLDERLWPFAVRSISDWKNDYLDICNGCSVRDACGGVFATSGGRLSAALRPIHTSAAQGTAEPEHL